MMNTHNQPTTLLWEKMSGAGNTFFISDFFKTPEHFKSIKDWKILSQKICKGEVDGLAILLPSDNRDIDFKWCFFNSDGSTANMCGNAACAVLYYAFQKKLIQKNIVRFQNETFTLKGEIKNHKPHVYFKTTNWSVEGPFSITLPKTNQVLSYFYVKYPIPHALVEWTNPFDKNKMKPIGSFLRAQKTHNPEGMNVTFFKKNNNQEHTHKEPDLAEEGATLTAQTYERGVENFTKACGTGALALATLCRAGMINIKNHDKPAGFPFVKINMPGGTLKVDFQTHDEWSLHSPVTTLSTKEITI